MFFLHFFVEIYEGIARVTTKVFEARAFAIQNSNVSSSATRKTGAPPDEIETAFASVCLPPSEAAHASSASMEGKWISAMRWKGGFPFGEPSTLVATSFVLPASF